VRRWARDLALGARFAVAGGPSGWARTALTAAGVALGVIVLLLAAAAPAILSAQSDRVEGRDPSCGLGCVMKPGPDTIVYASNWTEFHGTTVFGAVLRPDAGPETTATPPPGVEDFPGPGEMVVSPALGRLLDSEEGALLAERLDYERVGTIGDEGLEGSGELAYYAGSDSLKVDSGAGVGRVDDFRYDWMSEPLDTSLVLLIAVVCVVLLMPVAVFIATAVRFGGERRDRRLAALRLIGADTATTRRIAAGEALVGALAGMLLGVAALVPLRQWLGSITVFGFSTFPGDIAPSAPLTALILLGVPVTAVVVTLAALRAVAIEPLGVFRQGKPGPRRLVWRLLLCLVGAALLVPLIGSFNDDDITVAQASVGMVLLLAGVTLLLPWLVERLLGQIRGGPVAWQLAVRRIQLSAGSASRPVSGIIVAVAGATALYMLFGGVRAEQTIDTGVDTSRYQVEILAGTGSGENADLLLGEIESQRGVTGSLGMVSGWAAPASSRDDFPTEVVVADCGALRELARIGSCADGDVFLVPEKGGTPLPDPGDRLDLDTGPDGQPVAGEPTLWTVPHSAREATLRPRMTIGVVFAAGVFATPGALDSGTLGAGEAQALVSLDPGDEDAIERIRNVLWPYGAQADVWELESEKTSDRFASIQTGLLVGASGVMLLIGASMIVSMVEQLRDRKRLLSVLVAFGTRRTSLGASVLWQTAIPVALGLALAAVVGTGLGAVLMKMVGLPVTNWLAFLPMAGVGAGVIALVTLASMPFLWRLMRPDGLRTE
jgi:hypothetical protein